MSQSDTFVCHLCTFVPFVYICAVWQFDTHLWLLSSLCTQTLCSFKSDAGFGDGDEHHDISNDAAATSAPSVPESSTESSDPSGSCSGHDESSSPRSPPELERVTDMEVEEGEEVAPSGRKHPSQWTVSCVCCKAEFVMRLFEQPDRMCGWWTPSRSDCKHCNWDEFQGGSVLHGGV